MLPTDVSFYLVVLSPIVLYIIWATINEIRSNQKQLAKERNETNQKIYETLILREIGEKIGYELSIEKVLETIVSSIHKLVPYSTVSYILINPDPTTAQYRINLLDKVDRAFLDRTREYMVSTLEQVTGKKYSPEFLKEEITGEQPDENSKNPIGSLWITPLKINSRGIGVLALASKTKGLYHGPEMEVLTKILSQANHAVNRLEEVINREQSKTMSMILSMADGVMMLDEQKSLVTINPAAKKMLGLEFNQNITINDVSKSLSDKIDLRSKIDESISENKLLVIDDLSFGNGIYKILISPAVDKSSKIIGSVVILHDRTAQKELENLRDNFTTMMVHELRAPLTVLHGSADMFLSKPEIIQQDSGKELLETMKSTTSTMLDLVNDLLDASKIEAGKFQILKAIANLSEVILERISFFKQITQPKMITLEATGTEAPISFDFDQIRISQVLNNLLSNAIKFTPNGGKITVSVQKINSISDLKWKYPPPANFPSINSFPSVVVSVEDNGVGMSETDMANLFSKFRQLGKTSDHLKGSGLGLVIAKGIVESHGGTIFVESQVNSGTTVSFTLPLTSSS